MHAKKGVVWESFVLDKLYDFKNVGGFPFRM